MGSSAQVPTDVRRSSGPLSIEVLRPDVLEHGGAVMIGLFKAGADAEATPLLDRFSLTILKGIAEVLGEGSSRLKYVNADAAVPADFVIDGHIDEFRGPGLVDRMLLKSNFLVRIRAEVKDMKSGEVVALIFDQQSVHNDRKELDSTAYAIGIGIGQELAK